MKSLCMVCWCVLLLCGCVMQEDYDRAIQVNETQTSEVARLREELARRDRDLSRQAGEELALRKKIALLNERTTAMREGNRHLRDRVETAERSVRAGEKRRVTLLKSHRAEIAEIKKTATRDLVARDKRIEALEKQIRQLQELLAGIRNRPVGSTTVPGGK